MRKLLALAATTFVLSSCGGGSDGGVTPPPSPRVTTVTVTSPSATLTAGSKVQLTAVAFDQSGNAMTNAGTPTWQSSTQSIATVDAQGQVTGVAPGPVTITATIAGVTGSTSLTVSAPAAGAADSVFMLPQAFTPFSLSIKLHGTVAFVFTSIQHNVIFSKVTGAPADIAITTGRVVTRTFDTRGTFSFECTVHPGMIGEVVVQ